MQHKHHALYWKEYKQYLKTRDSLTSYTTAEVPDVEHSFKNIAVWNEGDSSMGLVHASHTDLYIQSQAPQGLLSNTRSYPQTIRWELPQSTVASRVKNKKDHDVHKY